MTKQDKKTTYAENARRLLKALLGLPQVRKGRVWSRIPGRERVYVDLVKSPGDAGHKEGVGHTVYVDVRTGFLGLAKDRSWAGPETEAYHKAERTLDKIRETTRRALTPRHLLPRPAPAQGSTLRGDAPVGWLSDLAPAPQAL